MTHHGLRVDDVSDTHLLNLRRIQQTKLDLLDALQRRAGRREVKVRHVGGVGSRRSLTGSALRRRTRWGRLRWVTTTSQRRVRQQPRPSSSLYVRGANRGRPPGVLARPTMGPGLGKWKPGRWTRWPHGGERERPAGLMRPGRAWATRSGREMSVGGVAGSTAGGAGPSTRRSAMEELRCGWWVW